MDDGPSRFTPTRVENTISFENRDANAPVQPHARGEYRRQRQGLIAVLDKRDLHSSNRFGLTWLRAKAILWSIYNAFALTITPRSSVPA
jgi:hypothetical protein